MIQIGAQAVVVGGASHETSVDLLNLANGQRTPLGELNRPRVGAALALSGGSLLVLSGATDPEHAALEQSVELVDLKTGVSRLDGELTAARTRHIATPLPDGTILITGSHSADQASREIYRPSFTSAAGSP